MDASSFLNSPTITLIVGLADVQETFIAHESLLTSRSDKIAAALKPGRLEKGETRAVHFVHEDPAVFRLYLNFVYCPADLEEVAEKATWENYDEAFTGLRQVYVLAEMLMDEAMKDALLSRLSPLSDKMFVLLENEAKKNWTEDGKTFRAPLIPAIQVVQDGTGEGDELRFLIVDVITLYGSGIHASKVLKYLSELPAEFVLELCKEILYTRDAQRA